MQQWCYLTADRTVERGAYSEARLLTHACIPLHFESEFLDALAERMMDAYEAQQPYDATLVLPRELLQRPNRTREFYYRLFNPDDTIKEYFRTWGSETLAVWMEESLDDAEFALGGDPHNADPVYDVLSIVIEGDDVPRLRVTQVKATERNLQALCGEALSGFDSLERGRHDAELNARLTLLRSRSNLVSPYPLQELAYNRRYRITAVHADDPDSFEMLTTFQQKIQGGIERRSVRLVEVDWPEFWDELGARVYARLD